MESAILVKRYLVSSNPKIVKVALQGLLKIWTEHSLKLQKILTFIKYESTNANVSSSYPQYFLKTRSRSPVFSLAATSDWILVTSKFCITQNTNSSWDLSHWSRASWPPIFKQRSSNLIKPDWKLRNKYYNFIFDELNLDSLSFKNSTYLYTSNLFVTSKKRNHEFANSPIHEFKVLQNVF